MCSSMIYITVIVPGWIHHVCTAWAVMSPSLIIVNECCGISEYVGCRRGKYMFFSKRGKDDNQPVIYVQSVDAPPFSEDAQVFLDPNTLRGMCYETL